MDLSLLQFYRIIIVLWNPTKKHKKSIICCRVLLFVLCKGLMVEWFNPKHIAKAYVKEYKLCFCRWFILFSPINFSCWSNSTFWSHSHSWIPSSINPYPTAFPYGNGMVLHFYQQQESSTTKTVHKVINKGLKTYV